MIPTHSQVFMSDFLSLALKKMKESTNCCICLIDYNHHSESNQTAFTPFQIDSSSLLHHQLFHQEFSPQTILFGTCSSENDSQSIFSSSKLKKITTRQVQHWKTLYSQTQPNPQYNHYRSCFLVSSTSTTNALMNGGNGCLNMQPPSRRRNQLM